MKTKVAHLNNDIIPEIIKVLDQKEVVVLPTEHTYGLISHGLDQEAVQKIYALKGRDEKKPLGFLTNKNRAQTLGHFDELSQRVLQLWPCPISIIVTKKDIVPNYITTEYQSVLLVCPDTFSHALVDATPFPIACTSANLSGDPPVTTIEEAFALFNNKVPLIIDGGKSKHGANGTIVDFSVSPPSVLRLGPFSVDKLKTIIPNLQVAPHLRT